MNQAAMKIITIEGMEQQLAALEDAKLVFDVVRRKQVAATPEEKVRQVILHYLVEGKKFPRGLLGVEASLRVNRLMKRCDIVVYKGDQPVMIVECKSPAVKLSQAAFDQAARYNLALQVPYLLVTNGRVALCSKVDYQRGSFEFLEEVPEYTKL